MFKNEKIDRREFLKLSATGAISCLVWNQFSPLFAEVISSGKNVSFTSKEFRRGIPTTCNLCPAGCGVLGFLQNDSLVAIQGNPKHVNNNGKICARGIAAMNLVYNPQRILYPMKRDGKRGEGKWSRISWSDAINEIANRLIDIRKTSRNEEFVYQANAHHFSGLIVKFLDAFNNATVLTGEPFKDSNKTFAQRITWGEDVEINDVENSRFILNFGANPVESHPYFINFSQRLVKAKLNNGAKLITIDPRLSNTAGKSDRWIPIKPGTDAIVALAMANIIMQNDLYDSEFISRHSNVSIEELKNYLLDYTPEEAERYSTIPADVIKKLAFDFATTKPSLVFSGSGVTKHINGSQNERCIMLLNAIAGNIDTKGGFCLPRRFQLDYFSGYENQFEDAASFFTRVKDGKQKVDTYISYNSNPVFEYPDSLSVLETMKSQELFPFSVAITTVMSETAALADIILPTTTYLESWSLNSNPSFDLNPFIAIGQPVIPPQGESKSLDEIIIYLSKPIGGEVEIEVNYKKVEDFIREMASMIPGFTLFESFDQLKTDGIWSPIDGKTKYNTYLTEGFKTRTRKFEINSTVLARLGLSSMPQFLPIREHINLQKDELILIPYSLNILTEDIGNSKWISEIRHENFALINPKTARFLKLTNESRLLCESAVGELELHVRISNGVHPDVVAICKGLGHWEFGNIAQAQKFDSIDPDTELIWWNKQGNGVNPNTLVVTVADPLGKGQGWKDTKLTVKRV